MKSKKYNIKQTRHLSTLQSDPSHTRPNVESTKMSRYDSPFIADPSWSKPSVQLFKILHPYSDESHYDTVETLSLDHAICQTWTFTNLLYIRWDSRAAVIYETLQTAPGVQNGSFPAFGQVFVDPTRMDAFLRQGLPGRGIVRVVEIGLMSAERDDLGGLYFERAQNGCWRDEFVRALGDVVRSAAGREASAVAS